MVLILMKVMMNLLMKRTTMGLMVMTILINRPTKTEKQILCVILMLILITAICLQVSILSDCVPRADNEAETMFHQI